MTTSRQVQAEEEKKATHKVLETICKTKTTKHPENRYAFQILKSAKREERDRETERERKKKKQEKHELYYITTCVDTQCTPNMKIDTVSRRS